MAIYVKDDPSIRYSSIETNSNTGYEITVLMLTIESKELTVCTV